MSNINFNKHYLTFKWTVSKDYEDKNGLYGSIQYKMNVLKNEFGLSERDIVDDLFANYLERHHYLKYDETKGSLNNWIPHYVNLHLNHVIRKHAVRPKETQNQKIDPVDERNWANIVWLDQDNVREDLDHQADLVLDETNPKNLLIAKETLEFIHDHFDQVQIDYLRGEIELDHAAQLSGLSCWAFSNRLDRRIESFRAAMKSIDQL
jgi:hypothetical protein